MEKCIFQTFVINTKAAGNAMGRKEILIQKFFPISL